MTAPAHSPSRVRAARFLDPDLARAIDRLRRARAIIQLARDPWDDHAADATPCGLAIGVVDELLGVALEALYTGDEAA